MSNNEETGPSDQDADEMDYEGEQDYLDFLTAKQGMDVQPPPWLCMKSKYIHMSMLIQGPKQPGNNINLYPGLLQEELDTLWKTPAKTWDASKGEYFNMRAALITTVQDYLG